VITLPLQCDNKHKELVQMPDLEFRFPEAFLEIGKDDDHSYNSLRTTRPIRWKTED